MLDYYSNNSDDLASCNNSCQSNQWIRLCAPTKDELKSVCSIIGIEFNVLISALDTDESSRIEHDDEYTMIIVNIPILRKNNESDLYYDTIPLSIICTYNTIITVCSEITPILENTGIFSPVNVKSQSTFILQILYKTATLFLQYLRSISKLSDAIEVRLRKSTRNHELIELLKLEKSLLYFTTALNSNDAVLEKLMRYEYICGSDEESKDLLEDVIIENKQAIKMAGIYSGILSGTMDAFASVISNNMNIVMRFFTMATLLMAIPTMIFSAYGMNITSLPFSDHPKIFYLLILVSSVISAISAVFLTRFKKY